MDGSRIVNIFVENIQLVVMYASVVEPVNGSSEHLPPRQIEHQRRVGLDRFHHGDGQNDADTFQRFIDESGPIFIAEDLIELTRDEAHRVNDELLCEFHRF